MMTTFRRWIYGVLVGVFFTQSIGQNVTCQSTMRTTTKSMIVTAYCPCEKCCGKWSDGKTAKGNSAYEKGVAVDRKRIPLGSRLDIPGYGVWIEADDVGGAIKGDRLDVRFQSHDEALKWGRKKLRVRVHFKE